MYDGYHNVSLVKARPLAAASRAKAAPYTDADPPAAAITASISSTSRSTA